MRFYPSQYAKRTGVLLPFVTKYPELFYGILLIFDQNNKDSYRLGIKHFIQIHTPHIPASSFPD